MRADLFAQSFAFYFFVFLNNILEYSSGSLWGGRGLFSFFRRTPRSRCVFPRPGGKQGLPEVLSLWLSVCDWRRLRCFSGGCNPTRASSFSQPPSQWGKKKIVSLPSSHPLNSWRRVVIINPDAAFIYLFIFVLFAWPLGSAEAFPARLRVWEHVSAAAEDQRD